MGPQSIRCCKIGWENSPASRADIAFARVEKVFPCGLSIGDPKRLDLKTFLSLDDRFFLRSTPCNRVVGNTVEWLPIGDTLECRETR